MNSCKNCGTQNIQTAKFCKSCGTPNAVTSNLSSPPQMAQTNPIPPPQNFAPPPQNYSQPPPQNYQTGQLSYSNTQNLPPQQQIMQYQPVEQKPQVVYMPPQQTSDVGKLMMYEANKKSATVAFLLCFFFGTLGVHRFYLGESGTGAAMLCITIVSWLLMFVLIGFATIWITIIWAFVDLFLVSGLTRKYNNQLASRLNVYN